MQWCAVHTVFPFFINYMDFSCHFERFLCENHVGSVHCEFFCRFCYFYKHDIYHTWKREMGEYRMK